MKRVVTSGCLLLLLSLAHAPLAQAKSTPFTVSPTQLSMTAELGASSVASFTLTTGRATVLMSPTAFGTSVFTDTRNGTCWQLYGAQGKNIPPNTSCTIEVRFQPIALGQVLDLMTVSLCQNSKSGPNGELVCTRAAEGVDIALSGTGTAPPLPDAAITSVTLGPVTGLEFDVTVRITNVGSVEFWTGGFDVWGWSSDDGVLDEQQDPVLCNWKLGGDETVFLAPGESVDVPFQCGVAQPPGYYLFMIDHNEYLEESNEQNNVFAQPIPAVQ